jgi:excisionase family DNA binding protein
VGELLSKAGAARYLGVGPRTVTRLIAEGHLETRLIGTHKRVTMESIRRYLAPVNSRPPEPEGPSRLADVREQMRAAVLAHRAMQG